MSDDNTIPDDWKEHTYRLSLDVSRFIALMALAFECSEDEAADRIIRSHLMFKDPDKHKDDQT